MQVEKPKAMRNDKSKVKPSDGDWNRHKLIKQSNKRFNSQTMPSMTAFSSNKNWFSKFKSYWKPKCSIPISSPSVGSSCSVNDKSYNCANVSNVDMQWIKVQYTDNNGIPKTTMAWVPMTN